MAELDDADKARYGKLGGRAANPSLCVLQGLREGFRATHVCIGSGHMVQEEGRASGPQIL